MTDKLSCDDCVYALKDEHDHPCDRCFNESNWVENHSIELGRKLDMVIALLQKQSDRYEALSKERDPLAQHIERHLSMYPKLRGTP